jgi:hypothetical protein
LAADLGILTVWVTHSYAPCSQHAPDEPMLAPVARVALGVTRMPATGRNAKRAKVNDADTHQSPPSAARGRAPQRFAAALDCARRS